MRRFILKYLVPSREGTTYSNTYGELRGAAPAGSRSDPAGAAYRREGRGEEEGRYPARRGGGRRGGGFSSPPTRSPTTRRSGVPARRRDKADEERSEPRY